MAGRVGRFLHSRVITRLTTINDTPHAIALGAAIGMFLAMTPTVGVQIILAAVICTIIRANRFAACVMVFVSNPLTMIPIYWADYWLGSILTGAQRITRADFEQVWQRIIDAGMFGGAQEGAAVLLGEIGLPMLVGGSILGLIFALPVYPLTYRTVVAHRRRKELKLAGDRLRELRSQLETDPLAPPVRQHGQGVVPLSESLETSADEAEASTQSNAVSPDTVSPDTVSPDTVSPDTVSSNTVSSNTETGAKSSDETPERLREETLS